jgi:hypothetical protein
MWRIPEPLDVAYAERPRDVSSAELAFRREADGGIEQRIAHAALPNVDREMLFWWMHHIGDQVEWEGMRVLAYRLWHPRDHIHWHCDGPVQPGCRFHIVEAFARRRLFMVDQLFDVPKLELGGFRIEARIAGIALLSIDEDWEDAPDGLRWTNTMRVRASKPWLAPLLRLCLTALQPVVRAWVRHNVEEVGFVAEFLPRLYAGRALTNR